MAEMLQLSEQLDNAKALERFEAHQSFSETYRATAQHVCAAEQSVERSLELHSMSDHESHGCRQQHERQVVADVESRSESEVTRARELHRLATAADRARAKVESSLMGTPDVLVSAESAEAQ